MTIKKPTIHSMNRRSYHCDYSRPGIYHITLKAAEALRHPLGKVVGDINMPVGTPEAPHVELTPVGQMVEQELLHSITAHYPMMEVQDYVIMPEHMHFIIKAHQSIISKNGHTMDLGKVIAGYKYGCNRRWWAMTGRMKDQRTEENQRTEATGTCVASCSAAGNPGTGSLPSLFAEGFTDVIPLSKEELEQKREYIHANPRSRLLRSSKKEWLQPQRGGIDPALTLPALRGYLQRECAPSQCSMEALDVIKSHLMVADGKVACDSYGNRELLSRHCLPVVCHRKYARRLEEQKQHCLKAAEQGAVLVSARIAKGEQEIIDEAVDHGFPVVMISDNGFPEIYHPSAERIERCATGQLLCVTPWKYRYRPKDESITVAECKTMNCIAQALCRTRDSWWMDYSQRQNR